MEQVYILPCDTYQCAEQKIRELLEMMGGIRRYVKAEEEILLKVNLLQPAPPEKAVSTHPSIAAAVASLVKEAGGSAVIADSPGSGYPYTESTLHKLYEKCGMKAAAETSGARLNYDTTYQEASYPEGHLIKHLEAITPILQADGVINLCKLKSHLFMSMTGAVKNTFGIIPGLSKVGYHAKLQDKALFAKMLLDLSGFVAPRLSIMDAVIGMEGDGPGASGTPRQIGLLLASESPLALDIVAASLIGLRDENHPVLLAARELGLSPTSLDEINIVGIHLDDYKMQDFQFPAITQGVGFGQHTWWQKPFGSLMRSAFTKAPTINYEQCIGCGICQKSCPGKAITISAQTNHKAYIASKSCIRCYCCHELCPQKAVDLKQSLLHRIAK